MVDNYARVGRIRAIGLDRIGIRWGSSIIFLF